ncbi:MAG: hypothetical protein ACE5F1_07325 [Planctomycetota bacterium]
MILVPMLEALTACLLVALSQQAPRLAWQLPEAAFVEYRRQRLAFEFPGDPRILYHGPDPAPGFYVREMRDRKSLEWPSMTAPDLIPLLALSLPGGAPRPGRSKVTRTFQTCERFGSIRAEGRILTEAIEGAVLQKARFRIALPDEKVATEDRFGLEDCTLEFTRRVDATKGRVLAFAAALGGSLATEKEEVFPFRIEESWDFVGIREPRFRGFKTRVQEAIDRGSAHLREMLPAWLKDPVLGEEADEKNITAGTGRLALILLTLVQKSTDRSDPLITRCLAELRRRVPRDTYSLGVSLMALESWYAPPGERGQILAGIIPGPLPRRPSRGDLELMQEWAKKILDNHDLRVDPATKLRFNYTRGERFDNSVTQYGVLGLHSAALCGVAIPRASWAALARHFLQDQGRAEDKVARLRLERYRVKSQKPRSTYWRGVEARGYGYHDPSSPTGSMTCAGLTGLAICRHWLSRGRRSSRMDGRLREASRAAFAWLFQNYDVRANPRTARHYFYYYLYGLERACELSSVVRIHDRDWYFDGAMQLIGTQSKDGRWGSLEDTCFSILFLKKSVTPVVTR